MLKRIKIISLFALLIVFSSMVLTEASAATNTNKVTTAKSSNTNQIMVKVTSKTLTIRRGATSKQKALFKVKKGTKLTVFGKVRDSWVKVQYNGKVGYVYNKNGSRLEVVTASKKSEDKAVKDVIKAIKNINSKVTLEDKDELEQVRKAYDKLSKSAKKKVTNLSKLEKAEEKLEALMVATLEDKIPTSDVTTGSEENKIPTSDVTTGSEENKIPTSDVTTGNEENKIPTAGITTGNEEDKTTSTLVDNITSRIAGLDKKITPADATVIESIRSDYENLPVTLKELVYNIELLESAESKLEDAIQYQEMADAVILKIDTLENEIQLVDEEAIQQIRTAYENLPEESQALVSNIEILKEAESKLSHLKKEYENAKIAVESYLVELDKLPEVSKVQLSDKEDVVSVRNQYEQLNAIAKDMISQETNQKLVDLESEVEALEIKARDEANAKYVEELIQKLDKTILYQDGSSIKQARAQYNALSLYAKSLVGNLAILENAEAIHAGILERVGNVITMIGNIPNEVTLEDKSYVVSVREAYEQLSEEEKKAIMPWELSILVFAEQKIERLSN